MDSFLKASALLLFCAWCACDLYAFFYASGVLDAHEKAYKEYKIRRGQGGNGGDVSHSEYHQDYLYYCVLGY